MASTTGYFVQFVYLENTSEFSRFPKSEVFDLQRHYLITKESTLVSQVRGIRNSI